MKKELTRFESFDTMDCYCSTDMLFNTLESSCNSCNRRKSDCRRLGGMRRVSRQSLYLKDIFDDFTDDDGTDNDSAGNFIPNRTQDNSEAEVTNRKEDLLQRQHHIPHEHRDKVSTRIHYSRRNGCGSNIKSELEELPEHLKSLLTALALLP